MEGRSNILYLSDDTGIENLNKASLSKPKTMCSLVQYSTVVAKIVHVH